MQFVSLEIAIHFDEEDNRTVNFPDVNIRHNEGRAFETDWF